MLKQWDSYKTSQIELIYNYIGMGCYGTKTQGATHHRHQNFQSTLLPSMPKQKMETSLSILTNETLAKEEQELQQTSAGNSPAKTIEDSSQQNPQFSSADFVRNLTPENMKRMSSETRAFIFKKIECYTIYETSQEHISTEMENSEVLPSTVKPIEEQAAAGKEVKTPPGTYFRTQGSSRSRLEM